MKNSVLWADDDAQHSLLSLHWLLTKRGLAVDTAFNYVGAHDLIVERSRAATPFHSALLDVILPFAPQKTTLQSYLGFKLAEDALSHGVQAVAFLTVVRQIEVLDEFQDIQRRYGQTRFAYVDKLRLLEGSTIDELISFLLADPRFY